MAKFGFLFIGSGSEGAEAPTVWDIARRTIGRIQVMRTVEHYAYILPVGCNPSVRVYSNKAIKVIRIYQNAKRSSDYIYCLTAAKIKRDEIIRPFFWQR